MKNSRSLEDLLPAARTRFQDFLARCAADPWFILNSITVLVTSTERDSESQDALYAQGRTKPGKIVTNARGGYSWHNFRCAGDVVPLRNGVPIWGTKGDDMEVWERVGEHGEVAGLEWAGRWKTFKEYAHFQYTGGLTLAQLRSGQVLT